MSPDRKCTWLSMGLMLTAQAFVAACKPPRPKYLELGEDTRSAEQRAREVSRYAGEPSRPPFDTQSSSSAATQYAARHGACLPEDSTRSISVPKDEDLDALKAALRACLRDEHGGWVRMRFDAQGKPHVLEQQLRPETTDSVNECISAAVRAQANAPHQLTMLFNALDSYLSWGGGNGSPSKHSIRDAIQRHIEEVRACYDDALALWPTLLGTVRVKFVIDGQGGISAAAVETNDTGSELFGCCVVHAVRTWSMPRPDDGSRVVVSYPFVFMSAP